MTGIASLCISVAALAISAVTAWLTLLRRGTVRMTRPAMVYFGPDGTSRKEGPAKPKIFLRSLVYSTGKRGHIIESMFATLHRGETRQTFNVWVYGEEKLFRGSGIYVGETGVACNHHFVLPEDGTRFEFLAGEYRLDVYAALVGRSASLHLCSVSLSISEQAARRLKDDTECGIYFDWGQESQRYQPHIRKKAATDEHLMRLLAAVGNDEGH